MAIEFPPEKLYQELGYTLQEINPNGIPTTLELVTATNYELQQERERIKNKDIYNFTQIKRFDFIQQKKSATKRADGTPNRNGNRKTYRMSSRPPCKVAPRRAGKNPSE